MLRPLEYRHHALGHISDLKSNSMSNFNLGHQELMFYDIMRVNVSYGAWP